MRARSLLASSVFVLAIGTVGSATPFELPIDPLSTGFAKPFDTNVRLAQAKLPSLKEVNLLAPDQGGQALVVPNDSWFKPISGKEDESAKVYAGHEAVYGFKDEGPAIFSKFAVLITEQSSSNPKQIEILVADDSATGTFRSIAQLNVVNAKIVKSPYQEVSFTPTTAKYVKVRVLAGYTCGNCDFRLGQIRLIGRPVE